MNTYLPSIECLALLQTSELGSDSQGWRADAKAASDVKSATNQHQAEIEASDLFVLPFPIT
jgi:hypothetical protein